MNEAFIMRTGDTFVTDECGCRFTVESGPGDEAMAQQAPQCCCGHAMHKEGSGDMAATAGIRGSERVQASNGAPESMAD